MSKRQTRLHISTKLPLMKLTGEPFKPDFLLVVKSGSIKCLGLDPTIDLRPLIYQLRDILDQVDDIQWAKNKKK